LLASLSLLAGAVVLAACPCVSAQTAPPPQPAPATEQPSQQPAPSSSTPVTAAPPIAVPTPVPGSTLPAMPPYDPEAQRKQDPLLAPIVVPKLQTVPPVPKPTPANAADLPSIPPYNPDVTGLPHTHLDHLSSTYIPVDSPIYQMSLRLYSMGYIDSAFIAMRPWTRRSLLHALLASSYKITTEGNDEAVGILARLETYLTDESTATNDGRGAVYGFDSVYARALGISGQTLRDSYHLGQSIVNDYGRPYEPGFNSIAGFSSVNEYGRFSLYVRGEYQHSPSGTGYSVTYTGNPLANNPYGLTGTLSTIDNIAYPGTNNYNRNQATIPSGNIAAQNPFRIQEATLSFHYVGDEISFGKSDYWVGPGMGGGMAFSNNAEDMYTFRINRVEPFHVPYLSAVIGNLRYDFFVGSLKGHTQPNHPWMHAETVTINPTKNVQFGVVRTVIWGGAGHEPITLHTFFQSFFNFGDTEGDPQDKQTAKDPGARFSVFQFSWRLPFLRHYVTLYTDSIAHDDVSPVSAPRRAAYRPGVYLSQFPGLPKLDFRVEGVNTDCSTTRCIGGQFNYNETIQLQGYTNKGFIMGDWIGREAKGGNAWLTYHLAPDEWIQLAYRYVKTPKDFIPGGTSQGLFKAEVVKRIRKDIEVDGWLQYERWKAPIYLPNAGNAPNHDTQIAVEVTWHPKLHTKPDLRGR
jgi:hypothetical protein